MKCLPCSWVYRVNAASLSGHFFYLNLDDHRSPRRTLMSLTSTETSLFFGEVFPQSILKTWVILLYNHYYVQVVYCLHLCRCQLYRSVQSQESVGVGADRRFDILSQRHIESSPTQTVLLSTETTRIINIYKHFDFTYRPYSIKAQKNSHSPNGT